MDNIRVWITGAVGAVGAGISTAFGGWTSAMTTLIIFMAIDYITGIMVAGIFKRSKKTQNGALESHAGFKGLCRKGVMLLIVLVACRLDIELHTTYIRDAVCIAFIANETISIIENAGLMGVPIPKAIVKAIELLKSNKEDKSNATVIIPQTQLNTVQFEPKDDKQDDIDIEEVSADAENERGVESE